MVQLGRRLGSGVFGEVHECEITIRPSLTITAAAKKMFPLTRPELYQIVAGSADHQHVIDEFLAEVRLLQENKHVNIVLSFGYTTSNGLPSSLLFECAKTTLSSILCPPQPLDSQHAGPLHALNAKDVYWYGLDILCGLEYLHSQHVIHRDIKPDNILMFEHGGTLIAKLGDLGLSRQLQQSYIHSIGGAPLYMAPEALDYKPKMFTKSDIYSFGIVLIQMAVGSLPNIAKRSESDIRRVMGLSIFCEVAVGTVQAEVERRWSAVVALERLKEVRRVVYSECGHCQGEERAVWECNGTV